MDQRTKEKQYTTIKLAPDEARWLFAMSMRIADIAENILEEKGNYSKEFLLNLKKSLREAKQGKVKKINSLQDLR